MALASEYVTRIRSDLAEEKLTALREGGLEKIHLAWGGPIDRTQPHYYRLTAAISSLSTTTARTAPTTSTPSSATSATTSPAT